MQDGDSSQTKMMPLNEMMRKKIESFRKELLRLHKILLDDEKLAYERQVGPINSTGHLLNLVMSDPWFDWLHRISELVVQIDETMEDKTATLESAQRLLEAGKVLFQTKSETEETDFMKHYKAVLRRQSVAVTAHAEVQRALLSDA